MIYGVLNHLVNMMKMTRSHKAIYLFSAIIIVIGLIITLSAGKSGYELEIVQENDGWAYIILLEEKPIIYQRYLPAIEGNLTFCTKRSAKLVGKMVLYKLRNNQTPNITKSEVSKVCN